MSWWAVAFRCQRPENSRLHSPTTALRDKERRGGNKPVEYSLETRVTSEVHVEQYNLPSFDMTRIVAGSLFLRGRSRSSEPGQLSGMNHLRKRERKGSERTRPKRGKPMFLLRFPNL